MGTDPTDRTADPEFLQVIRADGCELDDTDESFSLFVEQRDPDVTLTISFSTDASSSPYLELNDQGNAVSGDCISQVELSERDFRLWLASRARLYGGFCDETSGYTLRAMEIRGLRPVAVEAAHRRIPGLFQATHVLESLGEHEVEIFPVSPAALRGREARDPLESLIASLVESKGYPADDPLMLRLYRRANPQILDWMETHLSTVSDAWINLASEAGMDWTRIVRWLKSGRPWSLVALSVLALVVRGRSNLRGGLPEFSAVQETMREFLRTDSVPRTERDVEIILRDWVH